MYKSIIFDIGGVLVDFDPKAYLVDRLCNAAIEEQVYDLTETPSRMIVVGSGVTGAEFASAYMNLGAKVTLVSSRDQVLPGEDHDAAIVLEKVFRRGGMTVLSKSRAQSVERVGDGVVVTLSDGRTVEGSHCLLAVG